MARRVGVRRVENGPSKEILVDHISAWSYNKTKAAIPSSGSPRGHPRGAPRKLTQEYCGQTPVSRRSHYSSKSLATGTLSPEANFDGIERGVPCPARPGSCRT